MLSRSGAKHSPVGFSVVRAGGAGAAVCTSIAFVGDCCPGWKAEAQSWCFHGKYINAEVANWKLSSWTNIICESVTLSCSQEI